MTIDNNRLTKKQLDLVEDRLKWERFSDNSECKPIECEDVFIEYNPEILLSKKSQKYINFLEHNKTENSEQILTNYNLTNISNLNNNTSRTKNNIEESMVINSKDKMKETKKILNKSSGVFVPSFKLNQETNNNSFLDSNKSKQNSNKFIAPGRRSQHQDNNSSQNRRNHQLNRFSIKISNIINDINEEYITNWLFNISECFNKIYYKIHLPRNKYKKPKDFFFINLNNQQDLDYVFSILKNEKMEYFVVDCQISK